MPCRQCDIFITHGFRFAINSTEISAPYTADKLDPDLRIDDPIQIEAVFGIIVEGRSDTHLVWLKTRHIIKVVQTIIIILKRIIGMPVNRWYSSRIWEKPTQTFELLLIRRFLYNRHLQVKKPL